MQYAEYLFNWSRGGDSMYPGRGRHDRDDIERLASTETVRRGLLQLSL